MTEEKKRLSLKKKNTKSLYLAIILGIGFLIPSIYAAYTSNSLSLWTTCFLSVGYILASIASLFAYKMHEHISAKFNFGLYKLESLVNLFISIFLFIIILTIWFNIYLRLKQPTLPGSMVFALTLLSVYILINSYMYFRTHYYGRAEKSSVMQTQAHIYLIKLSLNIVVISSLIIMHFFSNYWWALYCDPCCSILLSIFIAAKAINLFSQATYTLLDGAMSKEHILQLKHILASKQHLLKKIHTIKTSQVNNRAKVYLYLEFDEHSTQAAILDTFAHIKHALKHQFNNLELTLVLTSSSQ
jgi:cation diffusion facilitator family transporter